MNKEAPVHLHRARQAEARACRYLEQHGLRLLARNHRSIYGEIDLVMQDGETVVFVEVRYRRSEGFGTAAETIDARKQARLRAAAAHYLMHAGQPERPCRFDVVALGPEARTVEWIQDAF